jgi:hypothetical protein
MSSSTENSAGKYKITIENARGIAIGDGAYVEQTAVTPPAPPPKIHFSLLTPTFPTAYCHHLTAAEFPFIAVTIDNSHEGAAAVSLKITAVIQNYSDTAAASPQVSAGQQTTINLLPLIQPAAAAGLNDIRPATLRLTVAQTAPIVRPFTDQSKRIHLHAHDTALIALRTANGRITDLTDHLAAWVTPRIPAVETLLRRAAERHPQRRLTGYQGARADARQTVRAQAQAIFTALKKDARQTYVNSPLSLGATAGQIMQRVRLPSQTLGIPGSANCIDGTVLFASLLELAAIEPLIVVIPGHAFVGWRIWRGVDEYEFLETTMIGSDHFAAALARGQAQYERALAQNLFARDLFARGGFARLVDIAACRARNIYPLE